MLAVLETFRLEPDLPPAHLVSSASFGEILDPVQDYKNYLSLAPEMKTPSAQCLARGQNIFFPKLTVETLVAEGRHGVRDRAPLTCENRLHWSTVIRYLQFLTHFDAQTITISTDPPAASKELPPNHNPQQNFVIQDQLVDIWALPRHPQMKPKH